jgi:hypothetical protein
MLGGKLNANGIRMSPTFPEKLEMPKLHFNNLKTIFNVGLKLLHPFQQLDNVSIFLKI